MDFQRDVCNEYARWSSPCFAATVCQLSHYRCIERTSGHLFFVYILSGTKQGCPASGTVFALAIGPALRFMIDKLPPIIARFGAYADDIATVLKNTQRDLPLLLDIFILVGLATALI